MFRWISLFGVRYHQSKARRPKKTVKLRVEGLEDRTMPSASVPNPLAFEAVASPPPAPSMAAVATYLASTMDQWTQFITMVQQDLLAAWKMLGTGDRSGSVRYPTAMGPPRRHQSQCTESITQQHRTAVRQR